MNDHPKAPEELSFEAALEQLEAIVTRLETGTVPLDEAIAVYEQGNRLRAQCQRRLDDARMRIEKIRVGEDGRPVGVEPFAAD